MGQVLVVDNPSKLPPPGEIAEIREPIIIANILRRRSTWAR